MASMTAECQRSDGIFANDGIILSGTAVTIDSFDSSDPNHSIWQTNLVFRQNYFSPGLSYGIWSNSLSYVSNSYPSRTANASVFTGSNALNVDGNKIAGYLLTGPNATNSISGGAVGDLAWCFGPTGNGSGASTGIEPGHYLTNANFNFQSYPLPAPINPVNGWMNWSNVPQPAINSVIRIGGMWTNSAGIWNCVGGTLYTNNGSGIVIGGIHYSYVITNRLENTNWVYYSANNFNDQNIFVDAQYVVLYLTNGLSVGGGSYLTINTNADMQLWSEGAISINGGGAITNLGNYTHAFSLYDVAGHPIFVTMTGSGAATGYFYLPGSELTFSGAPYFVGAVVCNQFSGSGGLNIHCDDSLGTLLPQWIVQQPANQIVPFGSNATFNVSASGSSPHSYQWFFAATNYWPNTNLFYTTASDLIPGSTNSLLAITNVQLTNAGYYGVIVTDSVGSVTSYLASLVVYTNATPVLSEELNPANGQFQLNVSGVTGLNYSVQVSTDLVNWVSVWTNTAPFGFTDSNIAAYPQRYYRSVYNPYP